MRLRGFAVILLLLMANSARAQASQSVGTGVSRIMAIAVGAEDASSGVFGFALTSNVDGAALVFEVQESVRHVWVEARTALGQTAGRTRVPGGSIIELVHNMDRGLEPDGMLSVVAGDGVSFEETGFHGRLGLKDPSTGHTEWALLTVLQ